MKLKAVPTGLYAWVLAGFLFCRPALAEPAFGHATFPGALEGSAESRWLAPYVLSSSYAVAGRSVTTVRWFDEMGEVIDQVAGPHIGAGQGFFMEHTGKDTLIYGTAERWALKIDGESKPDARAGDFVAQGEMFIHHYRRTATETMVDVYRSGKLAGSAGPFPPGWDHASLNENGCAAVTTGPRYKNAPRQVVVIGPDAGILLRRDIADNDIYPVVVGSGAGVLLEVDGLPRPPVRFHYFGADGTNFSLELPANARHVCTPPAGDLVLFSTSVDETERFRLLHVATGAVVWEIPAPVRPYPHESIKVILAGERILFLGTDVAAVDLKSGHVDSAWQQEKSYPTEASFSKRGKDIYIITDREFFRLNPANLGK